LDLAYPAAPILGYLAAGGLKFAVNCVRERRLALDLVGLGGLPSTHTSIVTTTATLVALREGPGGPAFAIALTLAMVVVIDALDLRRKVGLHAGTLRRLFPDDEACARLRERIGHSPVEVLAGAVTGLACGAALSAL
jgi:uncharacterized protein